MIIFWIYEQDVVVSVLELNGYPAEAFIRLVFPVPESLTKISLVTLICAVSSDFFLKLIYLYKELFKFWKYY